jgi:hypothetical protein
MRKISLKQGLVVAIKADTLSLVAFEIGLFGWMAIVALIMFGTTWHANPTEPIFWFMMQVGMTIGFFTSYPANRWLIEKGIKHGMWTYSSLPQGNVCSVTEANPFRNFGDVGSGSLHARTISLTLKAAADGTSSD